MCRSRLFGAVAAAALACAAAGCGSSARKPAGSSTRSTASSAAPSAPPPAASREVSSGVVRAQAGAITATLRAGTHRPRAGAGWPVSFTVASAGGSVAAHVSYEYMFAGQVVARRSHYSFRGHFADVFHWPSSAAGYPLTFRAVIEAGGRTLDLDYPVRVRR